MTIPIHPLVNDLDTVYTFYNSKGIIQKHDLPYVVHIMYYNGIPMMFADWCYKHCELPWGWFFPENSDIGGYIGFASKDECVLFCLSNDYTCKHFD